MNVRFLAPAVPGGEIVASGEIAEDKRRFLVCRGEVRDAAGKILARAEGKFFPVPPAQQSEMEERWRREVAALGGIHP
jgi:acyl-coenzyme A thioesterase PaaI-like protein